MSLSPCTCGATDFGSGSTLFQIDGEFLRRYSGRCRSCQKEREFLFRP